MAKTKLDEVQLQVIINGDKAGKTLGDLQQAQKQIVAELRNMKIGSEEWVKKMEEAKKVGSQLDSVKKDMKGVSDGMKDAANNAGMFNSMLAAITIEGLAEKAFGTLIDFASEGINKFVEYEKNLKQLEFSLKTISGEGSDGLERLANATNKLEKTTIYDDDDIVKAEKMFVNLGLNSKQIETLLPRLADFAAVTGDFGSATDLAIKAINGSTKGLKEYGIEFEDTGSKTENMNVLLENFIKFQGQATNETKENYGAIKMQEKAIDDLQKSLGEKLAPAWVSVKQKALEAVESTVSFYQSIVEGDTEKIGLKYLDALTLGFFNLSKAEEEATGKGAGGMELLVNTLMDASAAQKKLLDEAISKQKIKDDLTLQGQKEASDAEKKKQDAIKKIRDKEEQDYKQLLEGLDKLTRKAEKKKMDDRQKELADIDDFYAEYFKKAKGHKDALAKLQGLKDEEILAIEQKYSQLSLARLQEDSRNRKSTVEKTEAAIGAIRQNQRKSDHMRDVEYWQKWKSLQDRRVDAAQSVHDSLTNIANMGAAMGEDMAGFMKALALFQIGIDTAKAVSGAIASAQDLAYPYNLIAMGTAVTAVIGAIGQAYTILNDESQPTAPQFAEGGPMVNPSFKNGGAVNKPFMAIAGEAGPEWVAPNWMVESPKLAPIFSILEDIRQTKTFAAGGPMTSNVSTSTPVFTGKTSTANSELTYQLKRLNDNLEGGIYALFDWDYYQKSTSKIAAAKNSATIGK